MVPKRLMSREEQRECFRAVLFRMVPKLEGKISVSIECFRAVLFRMVPKPKVVKFGGA